MKKIIAGLGNPGPDYRMTRHNAGIMLVEKMAEGLPSDYSWRAEKEAVIYKTPGMILAKTKDKFMNQSGEWVKWLLNYCAEGAEIKDLWIVHDDLDIRLGEYKIQQGIGPKDHGGINSVEAILGDKNFWRVRMGIETRDRNRETKPGEDFVLEKFTREEKAILDETINQAIEELKRSR